jgi:hypothetical protein
MAKFTIRHTFDVDPETFWTKTFKSAEFNKELYLKGLEFKGYDILEDKVDGDGKLHRRVRTEPKADAPAAVRKVLGDSLSYVEEGVLDPTTNRYKYKITPSKLANKVSIKGELWVEPRGDKRCERIVDVSIDVDVFGVGRIIESFVEKTTRDSYDKATDYTRTYLRNNP